MEENEISKREEPKSEEINSKIERSRAVNEESNPSTIDTNITIKTEKETSPNIEESNITTEESNKLAEENNTVTDESNSATEEGNGNSKHNSITEHSNIGHISQNGLIIGDINITVGQEIDTFLKKEIIKPHQCNVKGCGARFTRPWRLEAHLGLHLGEKPFKCDHPNCEKAYTSNYHLRRHKRTAHVQKADSPVFKCRVPDCPVTFKAKCNEKKHYLRTHIEKSCTECGQCFFTQRQLARHILMHTTDYAPYTCQVCHLGFYLEYELNRHQRSHRIHVCPVKGCLVAFSDYNILRKHLMSHPFEYHCHYCNKGYRRKKTMKLHVLKHIDGDRIIPRIPRKTPYKLKPFTCDICLRVIIGKASLERHKRVIHGPREIKDPETTVKKPRAPRKDKGIPRGPVKSFAAKLAQLQIPPEVEQALLKSAPNCG